MIQHWNYEPININNVPYQLRIITTEKYVNIIYLSLSSNPLFCVTMNNTACWRGVHYLVNKQSYVPTFFPFTSHSRYIIILIHIIKPPFLSSIVCYFYKFKITRENLLWLLMFLDSAKLHKMNYITIKRDHTTTNKNIEWNSF